MKLTFIGTGSAFSTGDNYQSNILLTSDSNQHLLIDCGGDARRALADLNYSYKDIQAVYISHLHSDHIGGLEWLGFTTFFDKNCSKLPLYINRDLAHDLWEHSLSGGLSSIEVDNIDLNTYFKVHPIDENGHFHWESIHFELVRTKHSFSGKELLPSYGLFFEYQRNKIFITMDTQFDPERYMKLYQLADVIFHDCETSEKHSGVHAHYDQLKTLDPSIKNKMWLYHYNANPPQDYKADGFLGFVKKGQAFTY